MPGVFGTYFIGRGIVRFVNFTSGLSGTAVTAVVFLAITLTFRAASRLEEVFPEIEMKKTSWLFAICGCVAKT
jgi:hypothetical protein